MSKAKRRSEKDSMKKILIIGASILQLPAIRKAKALGYYVGVADYNPKAIGITEADEYFNVSTIDEAGVVRVAREFKPDGIMTLATDMPMRAVAKACEVCDLPGISYDTAIRATDKGKMIEAFEAAGVQHPWYFIAEDHTSFKKTINRVKYPCIIKPTDNAGSRGVVLCRDRTELEKGYDYAYHESRSGAVLIEEYLEGPEFSVEVIVIDKEPHVLQITDKLTTGAPHFVEMGHCQPTQQPVFIQEKVQELAVRACKAVGIESGPAHVEIILTKEGPKMVELGARMGGDNITTHLVPLSTGIDMVGITIKLACGEEIDFEPKFSKGAAIRYFEAHGGVIRSIIGVEDAKKISGVQEISIVHKIGERIGEIDSSTDRIGFVIAQDETVEGAVRLCEKVLNKVTISLGD